MDAQFAETAAQHGNHLNLQVMATLVEQIAQLHLAGVETLLVSSCAVATGLHVLGVPREGKGVPFKQVLAAAIKSGGSSLRDYVQPNGELGYFQHAWAVYGREGTPCPGCDCEVPATGGVQRIVQSGRSTFFCPRRQR